ncbi:MAG: DUF2993 domain-containing protein [Actinobacteria bacterium]|nr:DUF2993 domain-containing protein [Actinomycetota bacterium]
MRRTLLVLALLLVVLVAADQYLRMRVGREVEHAAARAFAASEVDADVRGWAVLPQLLAGTIDHVDLAVDDAVVGDPPIRVVQLTATLDGMAVGFPPPAGVDEVELAGGTLSLVIHEREVERLVRAQRPGWTVRVTPDGVVADGQVRGASVRVVADVVVDGRAVRLLASEVDAGELGPGASDAVAAAFETTLAFEGVPGTIRFTGATTTVGRLVIDGVLGAGTLRLDG